VFVYVNCCAVCLFLVWARLPMRFYDEPCFLFLAVLFRLRIAGCFVGALLAEKQINLFNYGVLFLAMNLYMFIVVLFVLFGLACQCRFTMSHVVCFLLRCFVCVLLNVSSAPCWTRDR
jgi:hypothetical protein